MSKTSTPGERVALRFAAVLDEKMKALLLKLRKGADASLSLPQLFKVLALLGGWGVEEIVRCVPLHYEYNERLVDYRLSHTDEANARAVYEKLKSLQVSNIPSDPKLGHFYVMDLAPFESKPGWHGAPAGTPLEHGTSYKLWVGLPGYKITSPQGQIFELLPSRHDVNGGLSSRERDSQLPDIDIKGLKRRLRMYDLLPWLKKDTTYLNQINELLGMEPHGPAEPRTRDNTGSCGVCFRNIKLVTRGESKTMALHGYNRPGHGSIVGRCWGEEHPPYELSKEATEIYLKQSCIPGLAAAKKYRASLTDDLTSFDVNHFDLGAPVHMIQKGNVDLRYGTWDKAFAIHKHHADQFVSRAAAEVRVFTWLVEKWETRPLPVEGERHIDWYMKALRQPAATKRSSRLWRRAASWPAAAP